VDGREDAGEIREWKGCGVGTGLLVSMRSRYLSLEVIGRSFRLCITRVKDTLGATLSHTFLLSRSPAKTKTEPFGGEPGYECRKELFGVETGQELRVNIYGLGYYSARVWLLALRTDDGIKTAGGLKLPLRLRYTYLTEEI
jgi:hypothetical protein